jgi:hypothetical protein
MSTASAGKSKRLFPAAFKKSIRSDALVWRIGSTLLIRNGSMMVRGMMADHHTLVAPGDAKQMREITVTLRCRSAALERRVAKGIGKIG